jgi:hypothetical protein
MMERMIEEMLDKVLGYTTILLATTPAPSRYHSRRMVFRY